MTRSIRSKRRENRMQGFYPTMIHPLLEKRIRNEKIVRNVFVVIISLVTAGLAGYFLFFSKDSRSGPFIGGALAVGGAVLVLLIFSLTGRLSQKYARANRLLNKARPREMVIGNLGFVDLSGAYAELRTTDDRRSGPPWGVVVLNVGKYNPLPKEPSSARVYVEDGSPDNYVLVVLGDTVYWGNLTTPESRSIGWRRMKWFFAGMTGLLLIILAAMAVEQYYELEERREKLELARASLNWPTAPGSILVSRMVSVRIRHGKSSYKGYGADISYRYSVSGREYRGDTIHFGYEPRKRPASIRKLVDYYPGQKQIRVAYDPLNPSLSRAGARSCR